MMSFKPNEIDHHTMKLIVGIIALSLAHLTALFSAGPITSISVSYYESGWAGDILVGFLFAISAFLLAYNGTSRLEMILSKVAAVSALGVALFPCKCGDRPEIIPYVHYASAVVMFLVLASFCAIFYLRARAKQRKQADWRATIYAICGVAIVISIAVLGYDGLTGGALSAKVERLVFYGERAALIAFGVSWLVASRVLPVITAPAERVKLMGPATAPADPSKPAAESLRHPSAGTT